MNTLEQSRKKVENAPSVAARVIMFVFADVVLFTIGYVVGHVTR